jgi:uncharacterized protein (DUF488 family)
MTTVYTIGHSSHTAERFTELLRLQGIEVLVDTRSSPYSRFAPQFDREALKELVATLGVRYLYLGDVVGGRPRDQACYDDAGHVLYGRVALQPEFQEAIARIARGAAEFKVALLCSEEDPAHCHRRLLISRVLMAEGVEIAHIRGDGSVDADEDVARKSGKLLVETQVALFGEIEEAGWRSSGVIGKPAARSPIG